MRLRVHSATLSLMLLMPTVGFAVTPKQHTATVRINHYAKTIDVVDASGALVTSGPLKQQTAYDIDANEELRVVVAQTNPLLFTYTGKAGTPTNTPNFEAIAKFADAIKGVGDILKGFVRKAEDQNVELSRGGRGKLSDVLEANGVTPKFVEEFVANAENLRKFAAGVPADTKRSASSWKEAVAVRDKITSEKIPETLKALRDQLDTLDKAALAVMQTLGKQKGDKGAHVQQNDRRSSWRFRFPRELARVASAGVINVAALEAVLVESPPAEQPKQQQNSPDLDPSTGTAPAPPNVPPAPETTPPQPPPGMTTVDTDLFTTFVVLSLNTRQIRETISDVEEYVTVASKIGEEQELGVVAFNAKQLQPFTVEIKPVAANAAIVEKAKLPTGKFDLTVGPDDPADFQFDLAGVYSFVETERYDAKTENNVMTIVRTDSGDAVNGLTGAPMLTIIPRPWNDPSFVRGFQIGFSPIKDELGIFGGGMLRFFDRIGIGAGIAYQQAERLGSGLRVGQTIAKADELKTSTAFKPGVYITLSVQMK